MSTLGDGLKGWWDASLGGEDQGNTVADLIGGNDLVTAVSASKVEAKSGAGGTLAMYVTGSTNHNFKTSSSTDLSFNGEYTATCWANMESGNLVAYLLADTNTLFGVSHAQPPKWRLRVDNATIYTSPDSVVAGDWYQLTYVISSSEVKFYINGVLEVTIADTIANKTAAATLYAGTNINGGNPFNGWIDAVRIYDRLLSPAEISELYTNGRGYDHRTPLNTVLPTLDMGVTSWTGDVGTWDGFTNGTVSYAWELRLVEDDTVVESGGGPSPGGTGTYNNANGYYLSVDATNTAGTSTARSKVGTLGNGLGAWFSASIDADAKDLSNAGNNGQVRGAVTTAATGVSGNVAWYYPTGGDTSNELYLDNAFSHMRTESIASGKFSISFWMKPLSPSNRRIFGSRVGSDTRIRAGRTSGGVVYTQFVAGGTILLSATSSGIGVNHFVMTWDDNAEAKIYVDGVEAASDNTVGTWSVGNEGGAFAEPDPAYGGGYVDDIKMYDRILSPAEASELYTNGRGYDHRPKGLGDEKLWLCPSIEDSPNDLSGNDNNGTYSGGMGTVADTSEGGVRAYEFDGVDDYIDIQGLTGQYTTGGSHSTSLWVYQAAVQNQQYFNRYESALSDRRAEYLFAETTSSRTRAGFKQGILSLFATADNTNQSGAWYHLASTYDHTTNTQSIYKNGVSVASQVLSGGSNWATNYAEIGRAYINSGSTQVYSDFKIDDFRSFTRALTQSEVTHLASGRGVLGQPVQGLGDEVAWYCPTLSGGAADLSGNGNTGEYQGGMGVVDEVGSGGKAAFEFDGVDDNIDTGNGSSTDLRPGVDPLTFTAWIKPDTIAGGDAFGDTNPRYVLSKGGGNTGLWQYGWRILGGKPDFFYRNAANTTFCVLRADSSVVNAGEWQHIALVHDGTTATHYLNGSIVPSTVTSGSMSDPAFNSSEPVLIGVETIKRYFDGLIDDLRVFNRALTQSEITHLASDRGVLGSPSLPTSIPLDYLWSPTQGDETSLGPIANIGTAGTQDLSPANNSGSMAWVTDTDKNGLYAIDMLSNDNYAWTAFNTPYTPVTAGCWVKCDDADELGYILNLKSTGNTLFLGAEFRTGGQIRLWGNGTSTEVSDGGITKTDWNHIVVVYDGTDAKLFINGSEIASKTTSQPGAFSEIKYGTAGGSVFGVEGRMDGMFLEYSVLTDTQIASLAVDRTYPTDFPPQPSGGWNNPFRNSFFYNPFFDNEAL
jgi:hypothetical protein